MHAGLRRFAPAAALAAFALLAAAVYWPSLAGGWVLDDWPSLSGLAGVRDGGADAFWRFVVEGYTGPTGRPLALLSFALQADAWPDRPGAFHAVNLALHLACGLAIAALGRLVARRWWPESPATADWIAVLAAGAWLVNPLNVSTTAYVVQRMAQLATLFTLLALIAWTAARTRAERGDARAPWWGAAGLVLGGLAAVLSKETGVLLLAYGLVLELWVFHRGVQPRHWRLLRHLLLAAPAVAFVLLAAWRLDDLVGRAGAVRDFTPLERLASEPRALLTYARLLLAPLPSELTLFNDDFAVSRGPFAPWTTLPAILAVLAAAGWALARRASGAPLAFAIAWFLGGHLLESTVLPLELYFEHRNYLPMAGPLLALAHYAAQARAALPTARARALLVGAGLAFVAVHAAIANAEARLWGRPDRMMAVWAEEHPASPRAQGMWLAQLKQRGDIEAARRGYRAATLRFPDHPGFWLDWTELGCLSPDAGRPPLAEVARALASARADYSAIAALARMVERVESDGRCGEVAPLEVAVHLGALLENPRYAAFTPTLLLLRARVANAVGDVAGANADFDRAFALAPRVEVALIRFQGSLRGRDPARIAATLADARAAAEASPLRGRFHRAELDEWAERLRAAGVIAP